MPKLPGWVGRRVRVGMARMGGGVRVVVMKVGVVRVGEYQS